MSATDRDGRVASFEGVARATLLRAADVGLGGRLRGVWLAEYVMIGATDGYRVAFALPELDPAFTDRIVLLAGPPQRSAVVGGRSALHGGRAR